MALPRRERKDPLTLVAVGAGLAVLVLVAIVGLALAQKDAREDVGTRFAERAQFVERFARAAITGSVDGVTKALEPAYAADGRLSAGELRTFRTEFEDEYAAEFDAQGRLLRVDPPTARPLALAHVGSPHVRTALRGAPAMSGVLRDGGTPTIGFATPFATKAGRKVIVDVSVVDGFDELFDGVLGAAPGVEGGRGLFVDAQGVVIASSGPEALNRPLADGELSDRMKAVRRSSRFELDGVTWQVDRTEGFAGVVAVGAPTDELYASVEGATRLLPWLYLACLSLAAIALVLLLRRVLSSRAETHRASLAKTEFLASASHELRTPLNGIIGFSQLLRDGKLGEVTDDQAEALDDVLSCSEHLLDLVSGLLDVTRAEAGALELHPEPVVLADLLHDVEAGLAALADGKDITVTTTVDEMLPPAVLLDPTRLRQVLFNFLSNALKHTPVGGAVTVTAEPQGGDRLRLTVTDTGPGLDPALQAALFTRYAKLDDTTEGTGLGLAVTRQIVEAQGGSVGCTSTPGQGATFYAELPLEAATLDAVASEDARLTAAAPR